MSARTFPTRPEAIHLSGMSGIGTVRFSAIIRHGQGTREIAVDVPPRLILAIADALRATAPRDGACPCDSRSGKYDSSEEFLVSHAVWHVEHPDRPMPCIDHGTVIDAATLKAAEATE